MKSLTERQKTVLRMLSKDPSLTYEQMRIALGYKFPGAAHAIVRALSNKGYIAKKKSASKFRVSKKVAAL